MRVRKFPTFFGSFSIYDYRSPWSPSTVQKTVPEEGGLTIGPFASAIAAEAVLYKLPGILPRVDDEYHTGVHAGPSESSQQWQIGMYQIWGVSATGPLTIKAPKVKKSGTIDSTVVDLEMGMKWIGIRIRGFDGAIYSVQVAGPAGDPKIVGNVEKVGNRVRVIFRDRDPPDSSGAVFLHATSVVQILR